MILYKFRDLSLKDIMRLQVDFYGEPVEVTENKILESLRYSCQYVEAIQDKAIPWEYLRDAAIAIIKLYDE